MYNLQRHQLQQKNIYSIGPLGFDWWGSCRSRGCWKEGRAGGQFNLATAEIPGTVYMWGQVNSRLDILNELTV